MKLEDICPLHASRGLAVFLVEFLPDLRKMDLSAPEGAEFDKTVNAFFVQLNGSEFPVRINKETVVVDSKVHRKTRGTFETPRQLLLDSLTLLRTEQQLLLFREHGSRIEPVRRKSPPDRRTNLCRNRVDHARNVAAIRHHVFNRGDAVASSKDGEELDLQT